ncbi:family 1 glycosylhydrolase [candidate division GN15 bacterium]|nr:family 1 glycosylhydrolase [candidate division GN15 bacterium]
MTQPFPNNFLWGVATSAFQIEGRIENDMTDWERQGRFRTEQYDPVAGDTADHWRRWEDDFELLKQLGVNSYRFSVEWARIEPTPGQFNQRALDQYSRMIDRLLEKGITPMLTLHHFTHPTWFHERSPWHRSDAPESFMPFVQVVTEKLLDRVPLVVTINEPLVWLLAAYGEGKFPPGYKDLQLMMVALQRMLEAHRLAYDHIKSRRADTQVGIAHNFIVFKRARLNHLFDRHLKPLIHRFYNIMIPEAFQTNRLLYQFPLVLAYDEEIELDNRIDFWGINYYYRMHVRFRFNLERPFDVMFIPRSGEGQSDLGWEIYPKGLRKICKWLEFTGKPLYITENGIAAGDDQLRAEFLKKHLDSLRKAIDDGYPVRGYYHWSFLDNYEWLEGTRAKFGLYHVDFENDYRRSLKPSGALYREYIRDATTEDPAGS